jgi:uncharacterized membrane protein
MILTRIYPAAWRAAVVLLTIEIAIVSALRYFVGSEASPPFILANRYASPFLILHAAAGVTALLVGPFQFLRPIRSRWAGLHRATGRIYILACAVGAPAGFMLALGTTAGPVAGVGFAIPALLWAVFTWLGWRAVIERRFQDHGEWMLRSYALTATAITLRLMLPASALLGLEFLPAYRAIAWLGWITNLGLVEYVIRRGRRSAPSHGGQVSAAAPREALASAATASP